MRDGEHNKAEDEERMAFLLHECVVMRFKGGDSREQVAARYGIEVWLVDNILREALKD